MPYFPPALLVLVLATALGQQEQNGVKASAEAVKQELLRLQGGWRIEGLEENGVKASPDEFKGRTIFFGRDTFLLRQGTGLIQIGALKLDPAKKPKTFNAMIVQGKQKGEILLGIYERDGDTLKVCLDTRGEARPKEFKTEPDSGRVLMICQRIQTKEEQPDLSGVYRSESTEIDGSKHIADAIIERMGDAYVVTYKKDQAVAFLGIGIRRGDIFCMSWISQGQAGITLYQIEKGHRLVGQYTRLGGPGILSQEILTRKDFD
jgi:uncharacterized protein (TIGR03067 family)